MTDWLYNLGPLVLGHVFSLLCRSGHVWDSFFVFLMGTFAIVGRDIPLNWNRRQHRFQRVIPVLQVNGQPKWIRSFPRCASGSSPLKMIGPTKIGQFPTQKPVHPGNGSRFSLFRPPLNPPPSRKPHAESRPLQGSLVVQGAGGPRDPTRSDVP